MPADGILAAALEYEALGWSVLPLCPPNHVGVGKGHRGCCSPGKRPFFPDRESNSGEWKEFQKRRATSDEIQRWFKANKLINIGVALGPVSGMVGIDVDDEDGEDLLRQLSGDDLPRTWEYTTGKGRRLLYGLSNGATVANHAYRRPGTEIEILRLMSAGGQVVLPPSVHPNGSVYRWTNSPDDIPIAPAPQWLLTPIQGPARTLPPTDGELITEGGRNNYLTSVAGAMRKRGVDEAPILAALKAINETRCDPPLAEMEIESIARSICRYAPDEFTAVTIRVSEPGRLPEPGPDGRPRKFKWASELTAPPRADDWLWKGYLPRSGITLLSAYWKAGKTTLLAHLLRALGTGGEFLGQEIRAARVLYVSEEGELHWVRRRDHLGIGDHAGFYLQPFACKPTPVDWLGFLGSLKADITGHGFDLVVFDTLAKLWPVLEENDAGAVDAALMPMWELTKAGAGVLLIHHLRKSGGGEYTASRGSGALSAFPDILIELTRFEAGNLKDRKRVLRAKGRYDETPEELVIELKDNVYETVADPNMIGPDGRVIVPEPVSEEDRIRYIMPKDANGWLTIEEIRERLRVKSWGLRNKDLNNVLFSMYGRQQILIRGVVRSKTDPRQYRLVIPGEVVPPLSVNGNDTETDGED